MLALVRNAAIGLDWGLTWMFLNQATGRRVPFYGWVIAWSEAHDRKAQHHA